MNIIIHLFNALISQIYIYLYTHAVISNHNCSMKSFHKVFSVRVHKHLLKNNTMLIPSESQWRPSVFQELLHTLQLLDGIDLACGRRDPLLPWVEQSSTDWGMTKDSPLLHHVGEHWGNMILDLNWKS